jgi:tetratricopeptide (TPR) repeat protein
MRVKLINTVVVGALLAAIAAGMLTPKSVRSSPVAPAQSSDTNETVRAAMEALRRGDFPAAIPALEKLSQRAPEVPEYQADLCVAYYSAGRPADAIAPCRKAIKMKPALTSARYFLAVSLAETGECKDALPLIEKDYPALSEKRLRRVMGLDGARCAMSVTEPFRAVNFLQWLNRDYPNDPDVLYLSTRIFSDLATLTSQQLLRVAPGSYQARQIDAEVLEVQGKNAEAIAEYRKILAASPRLTGIHYRIGHLLLAGEHDSATLEEARKEFEVELSINPGDAGSEYELGEMAREGRKWNEAIEHFGRAAKLDPQFSNALIGLGKSLVSAGQASKALAPLERAVKLDPGNEVAHYQLSFAYLRVGREADAKRELALYRDIHDQQHRVSQAIRQEMTGSIPQPQTAEPPE